MKGCLVGLPSNQITIAAKSEHGCLCLPMLAGSRWCLPTKMFWGAEAVSLTAGAVRQRSLAYDKIGRYPEEKDLELQDILSWRKSQAGRFSLCDVSQLQAGRRSTSKNIQ